MKHSDVGKKNNNKKNKTSSVKFWSYRSRHLSQFINVSPQGCTVGAGKVVQHVSIKK